MYIPCIFQLYFKIPDYTYSGSMIDPKSIQVSPAMKYKLTTGKYLTVLTPSFRNRLYQNSTFSETPQGKSSLQAKGTKVTSFLKQVHKKRFFNEVDLVPLAWEDEGKYIYTTLLHSKSPKSATNFLIID